MRAIAVMAGLVSAGAAAAAVLHQSDVYHHAGHVFEAVLMGLVAIAATIHADLKGLR